MKVRGDQKPRQKASVEQSAVMTMGEAAAYLHCHPTTLYRLAKAGKVPAFRLGGSWRFLRSEINRWIGERQLQTSGETVEKARDGSAVRRCDRKPKKRASKALTGHAMNLD